MSLKQWDGILKKLKFFFLIISSLMNSIRKKCVRANDEESHGQKYDETKKNVKDEIISVAGNLFYVFSFSQLFKEFLSF